MVTFCNSPSGLQHEDLVDVFDCTEAVRDYQYCGFPSNGFYPFQYLLLRVSVKSGCGFVKNQDGVSTDKCACNCDALLLSAGQADALVSDYSEVALRQGLNEIMNADCLANGFDIAEV